MKRYLALIILFFCNEIIAQENGLNKSINIKVVSKIDFSEGFDITDNVVGEQIRKKFEEKKVNFSDIDSKYFISVSFGWKYKRSTDLEIDNFKGLIIDKSNGDKIIAEFTFSKVKNLEVAAQDLVEIIISKNNFIDNTGKFIDVNEHFMKMNVKRWDSSRPDAHAPASLFADHIHPKGGLMIGYKVERSNGEKTYNGNTIYGRDKITSYYDRHITSQIFINHSIEIMYGIADKLTVFSSFSFKRMKSTYISKYDSYVPLKSSGFGDIDIQLLYSLMSSSNYKIHSNVGFSLPSGSINKVHDDRPLPYSMQLGSGHYAVKLGLTSFFQFKNISAGIQPLINIGINENSRGYMYGNELNINYWGSLFLSKTISVSFRQNYINKKRIVGEDNNLNSKLMILNNKNNSGSIVLNSSLGINFSPKKSYLKNNRLSLEYYFPAYRSYQGLQVGISNGFVLSLQYTPWGHNSH